RPAQVGAGTQASTSSPLSGHQRLATRRRGRTAMTPKVTFRLPLLVRPLVATLLVLACVASTPLPGATVDRYWEYTPYNVQMVIVLDTSTPVRQRLAESMPRELDARARVA